jgi:hypothetical protein
MSHRQFCAAREPESERLVRDVKQLRDMTFDPGGRTILLATMPVTVRSLCLFVMRFKYDIEIPQH